ncbi:MAG TPA: threonine ammonia-lyase IlvA [Planctomycetota bacterium]|nr:threonine ammonia-lyase IlvA [Planctomycetota bacterium]
MSTVTLQDIEQASVTLRDTIKRTPLERNERLSDQYGAEIFLKREDLQTVRSYKIRGAYNMMSRLDAASRAKGIVCASAGNHAQGVALSCKLLGIDGHIFMPRNTPRQKIARVQTLGEDRVTLDLTGDTFDETSQVAREYCNKHGKVFVHPFNDPLVIAGQATACVEIFEQSRKPPEIIVVPIGGGGLVSGVALYTHLKRFNTRVIGVEPEGGACMSEALRQNRVVTLEKIDTFVDGAALKAVGPLTFEVCSKLLRDCLKVPEGQVCSELIELYQRDGIIAEPAGALSVAALPQIAGDIKGKSVVCIISGGNNDISRYPEIIERSLVHRGLKHYFLIEFPQRAGALRRYLDEALGPNDDITLFEYVKKSNREFGPAIVGVELANRNDLEPLLKRMDAIGLSYELIDRSSPMFRFLV